MTFNRNIKKFTGKILIIATGWAHPKIALQNKNIFYTLDIKKSAKPDWVCDIADQNIQKIPKFKGRFKCIYVEHISEMPKNNLIPALKNIYYLLENDGVFFWDGVWHLPFDKIITKVLNKIGFKHIKINQGCFIGKNTLYISRGVIFAAKQKQPSDTIMLIKMNRYLTKWLDSKFNFTTTSITPKHTIPSSTVILQILKKLKLKFKNSISINRLKYSLSSKTAIKLKLKPIITSNSKNAKSNHLQYKSMSFSI
ncbi:MAG: hypothetical protein PVG30_03815 [Gammaproteobacteria bacterium]|jgi:hypothetical protein